MLGHVTLATTHAQKIGDCTTTTWSRYKTVPPS